MENSMNQKATEQQASSISMEDIRRLKQRVMEECRKDSFKHDAKVAGIGACGGAVLGATVAILVDWLF